MTTAQVDVADRDDGFGPYGRYATLGGAFLVSGVLLALAEWMAARGDSTAHFYVFWLAYFLVLVPVARELLAVGASAVRRGALVVALGAWSLVPSFVRVGNAPLYFDEFSHLRILQDLVRTGHPVSTKGLLQIGASFPGLEFATSALVHLSGLTLWIAALTVAGLAHVAMLAGVYTLARDAARSARAGAIAAVLYSLNPSWMFFDAQFSYETIALPILVWALVFALRGARTGTTTSARTRGLQIGLAGFLSAALVITHHVTSVVNCAALAAIAVIALLQRSGRLRSEVSTSPGVVGGLALWAIAITTVRFIVIGHPLAVYLGPSFHLSKELSQLLGFLGIGSGLPIHSAFGNSSAPLFEVVCTYLMLPVLLVGFVWAVWGLVAKRSSLSPLTYVAAVLGVLFFASLPLAASAAYAEAAHRSWAFSYLGLAIVIGTAAAYAADGSFDLSLRRWHLWPLPRRWHRILVPLVVACLAVVAVGGVAAGTSTSYRFGGAVAPQTDPLYVGTQTSMLATWFNDHATSSDVVWANRFAVRPIAVASRVGVATPGGSELLLVLSPTVPRAALDAFVHDHVTYIVFDRRTGLVGNVQPWFWYVSSDTLLPASARRGIYPGRVGCLTWANAVFATSDYEVLRVNQTALDAVLSTGTSGFVHGCDLGGQK